MGSDDLLASRRRDGPYNRVVRIIRIRVYEDILQFFLREQFSHRLGEHGLAGTGAAYHHHVPSLGGSLPDDLDCMLLTDDLVDEFFGYFDLGGALLTDIKGKRLLLGLMTGFC